MDDKSFDCPFCGKTFPLTQDTLSILHVYFSDGQTCSFEGTLVNVSLQKSRFGNVSNSINLVMYKCPACDKTTFEMIGIGSNFRGEPRFHIYPKIDGHIEYPKGVLPDQVQEDYLEACSISSLSPKSSATLSRRIIEGILTDFYNLKKGRLVDKIRELDKSEKAPNIIDELNSIRQVGNIATHFGYDKDVLPPKVSSDEAKIMIKAVEYIIKDTYIARHQRNEHRKQMKEMLSKMKH